MLITLFALVSPAAALDLVPGVLCFGEDNSIDLNSNGTPDCAESWFAEWGHASASSTSAWDPSPFSSRQWSTLDPGAFGNSGSMKVSQANGFASMTTVQCFSVRHWRDYDLYAQLRGSSNDGLFARLAVVEYGQPNCNGPGTYHEHARRQTLSLTLGWGALGGVYEPSWGTRSIAIQVNGSTRGSGSHIDVWADNLLFMEAPIEIHIEPGDETGGEEPGPL